MNTTSAPSARRKRRKAVWPVAKYSDDAAPYWGPTVNKYTVWEGSSRVVRYSHEFHTYMVGDDHGSWFGVYGRGEEFHLANLNLPPGASRHWVLFNSFTPYMTESWPKTFARAEDLLRYFLGKEAA